MSKWTSHTLTTDRKLTPLYDEMCLDSLFICQITFDRWKTQTQNKIGKTEGYFNTIKYFILEL